MKLTIQPVRKRRKGKSFVWVDCEASLAQSYEVRDKSGRIKRRVNAYADAQAIVERAKGERKAVDRDTMLGRRWEDVKDRL